MLVEQACHTSPVNCRYRCLCCSFCSERDKKDKKPGDDDVILVFVPVDSRSTEASATMLFGKSNIELMTKERRNRNIIVVIDKAVTVLQQYSIMEMKSFVLFANLSSGRSALLSSGTHIGVRGSLQRNPFLKMHG